MKPVCIVVVIMIITPVDTCTPYPAGKYPYSATGYVCYSVIFNPHVFKPCRSLFNAVIYLEYYSAPVVTERAANLFAFGRSKNRTVFGNGFIAQIEIDIVAIVIGNNYIFYCARTIGLNPYSAITARRGYFKTAYTGVSAIKLYTTVRPIVTFDFNIFVFICNPV